MWYKENKQRGPPPPPHIHTSPSHRSLFGLNSRGDYWIALIVSWLPISKQKTTRGHKLQVGLNHKCHELFDLDLILLQWLISSNQGEGSLIDALSSDDKQFCNWPEQANAVYHIGYFLFNSFSDLWPHSVIPMLPVWRTAPAVHKWLFNWSHTYTDIKIQVFEIWFDKYLNHHVDQWLSWSSQVKVRLLYFSQLV